MGAGFLLAVIFCCFFLAATVDVWAPDVSNFLATMMDCLRPTDDDDG